MAKLIIKSDGFGDQVIQLNLGLNRLGRGPGNDFLLEHPTVSGRHCEIDLADGVLVVRDCGSTNGTFVDGTLVKEATLITGQTLQLGQVELLVESAETTIAIPQIDVPLLEAPEMQADGLLFCPRHKSARAIYQCTFCHEFLCESCVKRIRRHGGRVLKLCSLCSRPCERIGGEPKPKKKSILGFLEKTVKLPFLSHRGSKRRAPKQ